MFVLMFMVEIDVGGEVCIEDFGADWLLFIGDLEQFNIVTHG